MSNYTGAVPAAPRKTDWRDKGACREANNDNWFPQPGQTSAVRTAKQVCFGCPVIMECAQYALRTRQADGVWGGLSESQRVTIIKNYRAELDNLDRVRQLVLRTLQPEINPIHSLRDLWDDRTKPLPGGHIGWTGKSSSFSFRGLVFTPRQLSFYLDRGHKADGAVKRTCVVVECIHPAHIADGAERRQQQRAAEQYTGQGLAAA